ncbi:hypothetical protein ACMD2_09736, partial [Ananas comosus]
MPAQNPRIRINLRNPLAPIFQSLPFETLESPMPSHNPLLSTSISGARASPFSPCRAAVTSLSRPRQGSFPLRIQLNPLHFGRKTLIGAPLRRSLVVSLKLDENRDGGAPSGDDFVTRVLRENPTQVEPKFLVGDRLLTLREKQLSTKASDFSLKQFVKRLLGESFTKKEGDEGGGGSKRGDGSKPVHLNDILREFKGKLYVPEEVFKENLSEEEEFERNLKELPLMSFEDFQKHLKAGKVKLLTSKSTAGSPLEIGYRDFIVDLEEIPGDKSIQKTKWAIRLSASQVQTVMEEYKGQQYEIERHTMVSFV